MGREIQALDGVEAKRRRTDEALDKLIAELDEMSDYVGESARTKARYWRERVRELFGR